MKRLRVLVVDDSVVFRSQIKGALEKVPWIEVVGVASNGRLALDKLTISSVDLMTLDLEMPELNGIETLKKLKEHSQPPKVIVFSSYSQKGAEATLEALNLGAADFVPKPNAAQTTGLFTGKDPQQNIYEALVPKIEALFTEYAEAQKIHRQEMNPDLPVAPSFNWDSFLPKAIVIGCSTGGPTALEKIFTDIKGPFPCPVFIVQHMPPVFTATLADRIKKISGVHTKEAEDQEIIQNNCIYIAPGNYHMEITFDGSIKRISINQKEQENSVRPAVDPLFRTAEQVYRNNCLGIILTGMGRDGLLGARALRRSGNPVIIQSRESCVVFGMPGALYEENQYDAIHDLEGIKDVLKNTFLTSRKATA